MSTPIDTLIDDARSFAASTIGAAFAELSGASAPLNSGASLATYKPKDATPIARPGVFVPATPPQLPNVEVKDYAEPSEPPEPDVLPDPLDGIGVLPTLVATAPSATSFQLPTQLGDFGASVPSIVTDVTFPDPPPQLVNPHFEVPVIASRTLPSAPNVVLPEFQATPPGALAAAPDDYPEQFVAAYREQAPAMFSALDGQMTTLISRFNPRFNEQMAALEAKLATYMAGGTALTPAIENAIAERTKDKVRAEYLRTRDTVMKDTAKRGFTMPSGTLFAALQTARQAGADNNSRAAIDIGVKQAELEQQNIQFAITTSNQLRATVLSAMIGYHQNLIAVNGQALDAAKSVLSALIEVYNTKVKEYSLRIEIYKSEAFIYEARLKAAMASIELYRVQIAAEETRVRVDIAKIEIYKAQIDSLTSLAAVYRSQVDSVVAKAGLERLKLELFSAQVQAYSAKAQAKNAEYQGYASALSGEEAKTRLYAAQVGAYATEVNAWKTKVDAKSEQARAIAMNNQSRAATYASLVDAFKAKVQANAAQVSAKIDYGKELVIAYSAANQAAVSSAQAQVEVYRAESMIEVEKNRLENTRVIEEARLKLETARAIASNSLTAGKVYGDLASSALSGMNTLVTQTGTE